MLARRPAIGDRRLARGLGALARFTQNDKKASGEFPPLARSYRDPTFVAISLPVGTAAYGRRELQRRPERVSLEAGRRADSHVRRKTAISYRLFT
jgi:hypothetical protein